MAKFVQAKDVEECQALASIGGLYVKVEDERCEPSSWNWLPDMRWAAFKNLTGYGMLVEDSEDG